MIQDKISMENLSKMIQNKANSEDVKMGFDNMKIYIDEKLG